VVGGDVLGPMQRETLNRLSALDVPIDCIHGNGERVVLAAIAGGDLSEVPERYLPVIHWAADHLDAEHRTWIAGWPSTARVEIRGLGQVLFCHATPRNDYECFTRVTADDRLAPVFTGLGASVVVCGHTHMPFDRMIGSTRVVNAGSVGQPFGNPDASWVLLGPDVRLQRTHYNLALAAERIRATAHPQAQQAADAILRPPPEDEMLELFGKAELKS
jgi:diadenosine tetraphosphatase ApaH/serine/threonine PP2A family protein phosphatase